MKVEGLLFRFEAWEGWGGEVQGSDGSHGAWTFRVQSSAFRIQLSGVRVQDLGFRIYGFGFRVEGQGSGVKVQGAPYL